MYLSTLKINVGNNPDRPCPGRNWLRNIYHVHQRLSMAFPDEARRQRDPQFLQPYRPEDFPLQNLGPHRSRHEQTGFLFRIDPQPGHQPIIVVQSSSKPDWDYAFHNAPYLLETSPECKVYEPNFQADESWRFRILINLSHKAKHSRNQTSLTRVKENVLDRHGRPKSQSKRVALTWNKGQDPEKVVIDWFKRKVESRRPPPAPTGKACEIIKASVIRLGWVLGWKKSFAADSPQEHAMKFRSALIEGELKVMDPQDFLRLVAEGVGAAKAFGFGLLSLSPLSTPADPDARTGAAEKPNVEERRGRRESGDETG